MKEQIYTKIRTDHRLQAKLVLASDKSFSTIRSWTVDVQKRHNLENINLLKVIREHLELETIEELLDGELQVEEQINN